jgi:hypothetical protein
VYEKHHAQYCQKHDAHKQKHSAQLKASAAAEPPQSQVTDTAAAVSESDSAKSSWVVSHLKSPDISADWVLDSGATSHMRPSRNTFVSYGTLPHPLLIKAADRSAMSAVGRGNVIVQTDVGEQLVQNIFHVPDLRANLISVPQLSGSGLAVTMSASEVTISKSGKTISQAFRKDNRSTSSSTHWFLRPYNP